MVHHAQNVWKIYTRTEWKSRNSPKERDVILKYKEISNDQTRGRRHEAEAREIETKRNHLAQDHC